MSVINQVLKDLDKRGANTNIGEATIRVVHARSHRSALLLIAAGATGMLGVGGVAWMIWQGIQQEPIPSVPAVATRPEPVTLVAAQSVVVAPPSLPMLKIFSVDPDPVITTGKPQMISLYGQNFKQGAIVTLTDGEAHVYANRPIVSLEPDHIVLQLNLGRKTSNWVVEVSNIDDNTSAKYAFVVKSAVEKKRDATQDKLPVKSAEKLPEVSNANKFVSEGVHKQPTQISKQQQADNEFHRAYELMREGRNTEAQAGLEAALRLYEGHEVARKTLVSLLLEKKLNTEAEHILSTGLKLNLQNTDFAMLLARLQVERNELAQALDTMMKSQPYAQQQADYQAFVAAVLQRQNRHKEAADYYQKALKLKPGSGVWLMGLGISLHADQRNEEARVAFKRALDSNTLSAELHAYVTQQLKGL